MLIVICGEDIAAARKRYQELKQSYKLKGYLLQNVSTSELADIQKSNEGVVDLFGQESVYLVDMISSQYKGRGKSDFKTAVEELSASKKIHIIDWEGGKSAYELTTLKKIASQFLEEKPEKNVFQLLDECLPGNLTRFHATFQGVLETQDSMFIYTLLWRHVRKLILAREGALDPKTPPWQRGKIQAQAKQWPAEKLVNFYEGLTKIDQGMKNSSSTFTITESIELLTCYYLK